MRSDGIAEQTRRRHAEVHQLLTAAEIAAGLGLSATPSAGSPAPTPPCPPWPEPAKPREVTTWIMTRPGDLDPADQASLDAFLASSPELAAVTARALAFAAIITRHLGRELEQWMTAAVAADEPALMSFVAVLRADQDAVTTGPTFRWSYGSVEGHINRMIKGQMNGRASPTCSASTSCSPTNLTETVPEPNSAAVLHARFILRVHVEPVPRACS